MREILRRWARGTTLRRAGACLGVCLLSLGASFLFYSNRARAAQAATQPRPVRPLMARRVTNYYDPSGRLSATIESQYARYGDHSLVVHQQQRYPNERDLLSQILDRQAEREIYLDPRTRSVVTMTFPRAKQESLTSGSWEESCPTEDMANATPGGVYFDYQTLHITKHWIAKDPTDATERWMIPELDCFTVKEIYRSSGARTEEIVESLEAGEPDRTLAAVPADYTERSPAAVDDLCSKATGSPAFGYAWGKKMEREYQLRKAQ
jgi:hypothetical protein